MDRTGCEEELIKLKAGREMVILMESWKKSRKRRSRYRLILLAAMVAGFMTLIGVKFFSLYRQVPSVLRLKAGVEQSFNLGLPMTAEVMAVNGEGEVSYPERSLTFDLGGPVRLVAGSLNDYRMNVKLFGWIPFKQVDVQVIEERKLIPMGVPVGIYVETDGILVIDVGKFTGDGGIEYSPCKNILQAGDYIRKLNGKKVGDKGDFVRDIEGSKGDAVILTVERRGQTVDVSVRPKKDESGRYKIGAWIRDNAQGVGTLTFIDGSGHFGALGHGINDVDTSTLMNLNDGTLYQAKIVSIKKGKDGDPGEMTGMIVYSPDHILGDISENSVRGIFGVCNQRAMSLAEGEPLPIGLKQEIVKGRAQILCTVSDAPEYYDIEILNVRLDNDNINLGIEFTVTDPELLEITGGIVQGMSGAPIVQNGKIVGAVTHVLVNDSERGYGIFIENMLE